MKINELKNLLLQEYEDIAKFLYTDDSLAVDSAGDELDKVQGAFLNKLQNTINNRKVYRFREVTEALKRIENGQYGKCEDCEDIIGEKRLKFNPCIRTCIACAEAREIESKKK